jgi:hypothetical protein
MSGLKCREFEMDLLDLARHRPLDAATRASLSEHVENCARCRHVFDLQLRLSAMAGVVADEASRWNVPFRVEQAVIAELRAVERPRHRRHVYALAGAAIAASLILAWMVTRPARKPEVAMSVPVMAPAVQKVARVIPAKPVAARKAVHRKSAAVVAPEQPFIAIPYTAPLEPYERADVVRLDLPVAALIAAGVPMEMTDPGARAQTDVLVGQDGRARAVRLVSISMVNFNNGQTGVKTQ